MVVESILTSVEAAVQSVFMSARRIFACVGSSASPMATGYAPKRPTTSKLRREI